MNSLAREPRGQAAPGVQVAYLGHGFLVALHYLPELYQVPQVLGGLASALAAFQQLGGGGQFLQHSQLALHLVHAAHQVVEDVAEPLHGVKDGLGVSFPGHEHGWRGVEEVLVPREDLLEVSHVDVLQDTLEQEVQGLEVHHPALWDGDVDQLREREREAHSAGAGGRPGWPSGRPGGQTVAFSGPARSSGAQGACKSQWSGREWPLSRPELR